MTAAAYYQNKLALVTGGSEGIGLAIAQALYRAGSRVIIVSRDPEKQKAALRTLSAKAVPLDVTSYAEVARSIEQILTRFGLPDFVINSAGFTLPGYLDQLDLSDLRAAMDANFFGTAHMVHTLLPHLLRRRSGHIVNVSSLGGLIGISGYSAYSASKYAVVGFSEALRREVAPFNVRVSLLCPANVRTPGLEKENQIKPADVLKAEEKVKTASPEAVADALLKALPKNPPVVIPTWDGRMAWRLTRWFPAIADRILARTL